MFKGGGREQVGSRDFRGYGGCHTRPGPRPSGSFVEEREPVRNGLEAEHVSQVMGEAETVVAAP